MFKRLLSAFGKTVSTGSTAEHVGLHSPYSQSRLNYMYNLLFCDDLDLFRRENGETDSTLWQQLLAERPDVSALLRIADDKEHDGRVRALAYNRLRMLGETPPSKKLLGTIVEVPLDGGLDVLAAFSDGGVRYLNHAGKVAVFEGADGPVGPLAFELLAAAQPVVDQIGPWEEQRLPPPKPGNVRLSFLVSDGLYFGEGPFAVLQQDGMAGPILSKAIQLLKQATAVATSAG